MTVLYYSIMEAVALIFTLFISIPLTISYALIYISGIFFTIMLVSIILFSCIRTPRQSNICYWCVVLCIVLHSLLFALLALVAVVAMTQLFSYLKVKGFETVSLRFSVFPSLALSLAGWFIRKKLLKEDIHAQPAHLTDNGATGHSLNDGGRGRKGLEAQQHLLV